MTESQWTAVVERDESADGQFVYAVKTTGVYCRPSCSSRRALRENVEFFGTNDQAESAGFRACKRCRPNQTSLESQRVELVAEACRLIENTSGLVSLDEIARHALISPFHFHRIFKEVSGVTPKAYGAKFGRQVANPQAGDTVRFGVGECNLGSILVAASDEGLIAILLGDDPNELAAELQRRFPKADLVGGDKEFETWMATVIGFINESRPSLDLPLDIRGTAFQQRVWKALRDIPFGTTATYQDIANAIGSPSAVRAVAGACGANHLAIAIPCHRVVKSDGSLSGYRWGVERKAELLRRESAS